MLVAELLEPPLARSEKKRPTAAIPLPPGEDLAIKPGGRMGILWIILIGFVAGLIARWISPGPNTPQGFILTVVLGIAGAFLATWLGQMIGWYRPDQGAGFIGATIGAVLVLFIWNRLVAARVISDPGAGPR
jgi:uncharacterized membrane protein YeaQ/YmgE (transglycosylase-associated protein family)